MKSKHCFQRFTAALACLMLCVLCMPHTALAKGYNVLPEKQPCSIELSYSVDGQPIEGVRYELYLVAAMDENVQLTLTDKFAALQPLQADGMDPNNLSGSLNTTWAALAETLYQNLGDMEPDATATTDADGIAKAEGLEMGLWLVAGQAHNTETAYDEAEVYYRPVPFLVALPTWVETENRWVSDVNVTSKPMAFLTARRVLKVWDDGNSRNVEHPAITVQLMRNGVDYGDPVTLDDSNNWRYDFGELERLDGTDPISWTVREVSSLGGRFTVSISQQGITLVLTNTYHPPLSPIPDQPDPEEDIEDPDVPLTDLPSLEEIEEPDVPPTQPDPEEDIEDPDVPLASLPQTGQLWWPVPVLAAAGVMMFLFGLKRRSGANYEE